MSNRQTAIDVLLWIGTMTTVICCLGMLVMKDFFEKLHYMATVATISAFAILAAVLLQEGWGQAGVKAILVCGVLLLMNSVLTHATARAARVRKLGHWTPQPGEQIEGTKGRGGSERQGERKSNE
ncbi:MAG: cation:proton antiporter [Terriglobales bacterium]